MLENTGAELLYGVSSRVTKESLILCLHVQLFPHFDRCAFLGILFFMPVIKREKPANELSLVQEIMLLIRNYAYDF